MTHHTLHGAGLGLRRELIPALRSGIPDVIDFLELAPENWMEMGGARRKDLHHFAERLPIVAHGLSLSLGGPAPLDEPFLRRVKTFLDAFGVALYTEHLSWCADAGQLYELFPIPHTGEAVRHMAARIRRTQELLERRIAVENPSYYVLPPHAEMTETAFIRAVVEEADCDLHLDVNNVYVNSCNFGFDPWAFIKALPVERVVYLHVAGHYRQPDGLVIDTHGAAVIDPVWQLLERTYTWRGAPPTLLERDFNLPPLEALLGELATLRALRTRCAQPEVCHAQAA